MWANDVHAEYLVVLLFADHFDETLFFAEYARLTRSGERKLADLHVVSLLLRLGFSQSHRRHFRIAVGAIWHQPEIDGPYVFLPGHMFNSHDALFGSKV